MRKRFFSLFLASALTVGTMFSADPSVVRAEESEKSTGTTYYIDSENGDDEENGTTEETAWKTLDKVNSVEFQPGDSLLFKRNSVFYGQLAPQGSGTEEAPISIDTYGEGEKPLFDGEGREGDRMAVDNEGAVVVLHNQDYWEINNIRVTNDAEQMGERFGILVRWHDYGTGQHVYIRNCDIFNIKGMYEDGVNNGVDKTRFQGDGIIVVGTGTRYTGTPTTYNDILIEGNTLDTIDRTGITIWNQWADRPGAPDYYNRIPGFHREVGEYRASTNVVIRNNRLNSIAGDGILVNCSDGALIEHNTVSDANCRSVNDPNVAIWPHNSDNTVMQFNEVYNTRNIYDGQAFDVDFLCDNTLIQYNYSHDNEGGFLLVMGNATNTTVRYNISQNDMCGVLDHRGPDLFLYNNVFYMTAPMNRSATNSGVFANNIFYAEDSSVGANWGSPTYTNNCYYNFSSIPDDANAVTEDPLLADPGSGKTGMDTLEGYKLLENSPCINAGLALEEAGTRDFFGNILEEAGVPDIGASDTLTEGKADYNINLALGCDVDVSSTIDNYGWNRTYLTDGNWGNSNAKGWTTESQSSVENTQWAEIDLGRTVSMNKFVLTNSDNGFPVDFNIQVYGEDNQWKKVVEETGYVPNSASDRKDEVFVLDTPVSGSKIKIECTKLKEKTDGIYAQIGECEVYYIDTEALKSAIENIKSDPEKTEIAGAVLEEAEELYSKGIEEADQKAINSMVEKLASVLEAYESNRVKYDLLIGIAEAEKLVKESREDQEVWQPAVYELETGINKLKPAVSKDDADVLEKALDELKKILDKFESEKSGADYFVDDLNHNDYMQESKNIQIESSNQNNGNRNSAFPVDASQEAYIVYALKDDIRHFMFYNGMPTSSDTGLYLSVYTAGADGEYKKLDNVETIDFEEGITKRIYRCDDLPEGTKTIKITFPAGKTWQYSVQHVVLQGGDSNRAFEIELEKDEAGIRQGESKKIEVLAFPRSASENSYNWTVTDAEGNETEIASVDENGRVTSNGSGSAWVWASAKEDNKVCAKTEVNLIGSTGMEISKLPGKLTYSKGEKPDLSDGKARIAYEDGSEKEISFEDAQVSGFDPDSVGKQTLTLSYAGQTATFEIEVTEPDEEKPEQPGDTDAPSDDEDPNGSADAGSDDNSDKVQDAQDKKDEAPEAIETGISENILVWLLLAGGSAVFIAGSTYALRRKKH